LTAASRRSPPQRGYRSPVAVIGRRELAPDTLRVAGMPEPLSMHMD
jgi:hypothetical protein